ncbi:hypothetical protein IAT38_001584 [Cryptococcus sp. DSM 104549]
MSRPPTPTPTPPLTRSQSHSNPPLPRGPPHPHAHGTHGGYARPHSQSTSQAQPPYPKPPRLLPRSPSEPLHLARFPMAGAAGGAGGVAGVGALSPRGSAHPSPQQPIYVLTADGSSLFLLDPSKPTGGEEPPPYASFNKAAAGGEGGAEGEGEGGAGEEGESSTTPRIVFPSLTTAGELLLPHADGSPQPDHPDHPGTTRHRARTLSTLSSEHPRSRPRTSTLTQPAPPPRPRRARSALSTPEGGSAYLVPDERTPLLFSRGGELPAWARPGAPGAGGAAEEGLVGVPPREVTRGVWRSVWCGDLDEGEAPGGWGDGWKRYWRPMGRGRYWLSALHLVLLNFPFALVVWPPLLAGTLAGTVLLITLPIGAAVWWLTLFISRSAARLETVMQVHYHAPLSPSAPAPQYHPIFHRLLPRSTSPVHTPLTSPPVSSATDGPPLALFASHHSHHSHHSLSNSHHSLPDSPSAPSHPAQPAQSGQQWEKRFLPCSYAMFLDHSSYSALSYFLLLKPLITLFSTILVVASLALALGTVVGLPVWLRVMRRWGRWQAEVAVENL